MATITLTVPDRIARRALSHLGRRGLTLAVAGSTWVVIGVLVVASPPSASTPLLEVHPGLLGTVWIVTGVAALWSARQPQGIDWPGWAGLCLMSAYRAIAHGWAYGEWLMDGGRYGDPHGLTTALAWLVITMLILIGAGWREDRTP